MRIVLSCSGGKDCILALHHLVEDGHEPTALLVMYRRDAGRSWVHGLDQPMLSALADALGLPLLCCEASEQTYAADMERTLRQAQDMGAEACVFGDIDTEEHRRWDEARCAAAGLKAVLPLWQRDRMENAEEAVQLGYRCLIKCVRNGVLPESFLGNPLTLDLLDKMRQLGVDPCGENGEYHTVVVDGPLFHHPVEVQNHGILRMEHISAVELRPISR